MSTLRKNTERPVTVEKRTNQIVGTDRHRVVEAARRVLRGDFTPAQIPPLWDGKAAGRFVDILLEHYLYEPAAESAKQTSGEYFSK